LLRLFAIRPALPGASGLEELPIHPDLRPRRAGDSRLAGTSAESSRSAAPGESESPGGALSAGRKSKRFPKERATTAYPSGTHQSGNPKRPAIAVSEAAGIPVT